MDELIKSVDWLADWWFAKFHAADLTDEFKAWWVAYYGVPHDFNPSLDSQATYWIRCSFALQGWRAAINDR